MSDEAQGRIARYQQLYDDASTWRQTIGTVAELVRPFREEIGGKLTDGSRRLGNVYDATGILANNNLGAAVYGSASNPADQWFQVGTDDPDFDKWPKAASALGTYTRRTFASYGPSYSYFYGQTFPLYLDTTGLGTGYFYQDLRPDRSGFLDKCLPLSECEFDVDEEGRPREFYRKWCTSVSSLAAMFKDPFGDIKTGVAKLSPPTQKKFADNPASKIDVLHAVCANPMYRGGVGSNSKPWSSCYFEVAEKHQISEAGYADFPFYVPRWEISAGERKGRGAGEIALSDILSLQVMTKANLMAGEWAANPALGMPHENSMNVSRMRPGSIVAGAIDPRTGNQLLQMLHKNMVTPFSLEMANQLRQAVKDAFEGAIINIVTPNRTGMTPTEVLDVREERFRRMAPYQGNITVHFLDPHVRRRMALLEQEGVFRDIAMPSEMKGRTLQPKFISPMAMAQMAAKASSALRAAGALAQAAQLDPSVADRFNGDGFAKVVGKGWSVPEILNDDDVTDQRRQARQQQQTAQANAAIAEQAAGAAKDGAGAVAQLRAPQAA